MAKLYPPYIEGKIPAFAKNSEGNTVLVVPFRLNRAVGANDFIGLSLIIKSMTTGVARPALKATQWIEDPTIKGYRAYFDFNDCIVGQYYKIQMAFISENEEIGFYSTVGVVKCTAQPEVKILGVENKRHQYEYTGEYTQTEDTSEKVYSYDFNLYDSQNVLVTTSGQQIHNSSTDTTSTSSTDTWVPGVTLEQNATYYIEYNIKTLNGYVGTSGKCPVQEIETVEPTIPAELRVEMIDIDGCARIYLQGDGSNDVVSGRFILLRSSSEDDYGNWNTLCKFNLVQEYPDYLVIWEDFTVHHGEKYLYAIQAYGSNNIYSNRKENIEGPVLANFEDAYLFDGERQLSIRFNPKVSSFKSTVLENKKDVIGGYPFFFRNGSVEYKEFPISGLISRLSDPNNRFMQVNWGQDDQRRSTPAEGEGIEGSPTDLTSANFKKEREFKMEVLNWLNNGKPKLFRSPAEGNYIVRLMNVTMSPNDTLGRMLHTFNCTAYEIAKYNFENLSKYGFVASPATDDRGLRFRQLTLNNLPIDIVVKEGKILLPPAYIVSITDATPGIEVEFEFTDGLVESFYIGSTGAFYIEKDIPILSIKLKAGQWDDAKLTYGYYDEAIMNDFTIISDIQIHDEIKQFIGNGEVDFEALGIEDVRKKTGRFYYIRVLPRDVVIIYNINGNWYKDIEGNIEVTNWSPAILYWHEEGQKYYEGNPADDKTITKDELDSIFKLNEDYYIDFSTRGNHPVTSGRYEALTDIDKVTYMYIGNGLIVDAVYQIREFEYTIEKENEDIIEAKGKWLTAKARYEVEPNTGNQIDMERAYVVYIEILKQELEELGNGFAI